MTNKNFYFQGKYFETDQEMFDYAIKWNYEQLTEETAERILSTLSRDIVMNIFLRGLEFDNSGFTSYIDRIFEFSMKTLMEFKKE